MLAFPELKKTKPVKFSENEKFLEELRRLSPHKEAEALTAVSLCRRTVARAYTCSLRADAIMMVWSMLLHKLSCRSSTS